MAKVIATILWVVLLVGSAAAHNCKCRYAGGEAAQGELRCIKTSEGLRLARCEMVLNNSSWTMLQEKCTPDQVSRLPHSVAVAQR